MNTKIKLLIATSTCLALIMFNMSIIAIALPVIIKSFTHVNYSGQWVISAYILSLVSIGLVTGKLSDSFEPKKIVLIGLCLFGLSSLFCALSNSLIKLIFYRSLQGISSALLITPSIKMLAEFFNKNGFGKVIGVVTGYGSIGLILSSLFGGVLIEHFGWSSFFYINFLISIIIIILLVSTNLEKSKKTPINKFDIISFILMSAFLCTFVFLIMEGHNIGWLSYTSISLIAIFIICLILFIFIEKCKSIPIIKRSLVLNKSFISVNIITILSELMSISTIFLVLYIQKSLNYIPSVTGWLIFPLYFLFLCSNFISSIWINRAGVYYPLMFSLILILFGYIISFCLLSEKNYISITPIIISLGFGLYLINNSVKTILVEISPQDSIGVSLGFMENTRYISATISFAILSSIVSYYKLHEVHDYFYYGFEKIILLCIFIAITGVVICYKFLRFHIIRDNN